MVNNNNCPIITKYRPTAFDQVLGNELVIRSLTEAVRSESCPHAYLFTGSAGLGKTTLARIIASEVNAFVEEMDAASNSGVDDTRRIVEASKWKPIMHEKAKLLIIDEAHSLSKQAWQPLLKLLEEPPSFLYIALCTTEIQKVPETIRTRCHPVALKPLKAVEIEDLVAVVSELEGWEVNNDVFSAIVQAAGGSARKALTILQAGHALTSREDLGKVVMEVESEDSSAVKLCQYLIKGGESWKVISPILEGLDGDEEAAIAIIGRYLTAAMARSDEEQAKEIYRMLRSFTETTNWDKKIQLYAGVGKMLWGKLPF